MVLAARPTVDNGTGAIRGVYLQRNETVRRIFAAWMEPFRNLGMTTLAIRNTEGTDHVAFDEVGLPGFQFIASFAYAANRDALLPRKTLRPRAPQAPTTTAP